MFTSKSLNLFIIVLIVTIDCSTFVYGSFMNNFIEYTTEHLVKENRKAPRDGILDPFKFNKSISIDSSLRLDLSFDGFLKGYSDFDIENMDITSDLNTSFAGTLKDTQVSGTYKMNGTFYEIVPVIGEGKFLFHFKNFQIVLNTQILPDAGHIQFATFNVDYSFDDFQISISGLTGDKVVGDILQEFTKDFLSSGLSSQRNAIRQFARNYLLNEGNAKLKYMTLHDFINLFKKIFDL